MFRESTNEEVNYLELINEKQKNDLLKLDREKQAQTIAQQEHSLAQRENWIWVMVVLMLLVLVIALLLFFMRSKERKSKQTLLEKNAQIVQQNQQLLANEQEMQNLISVVAHDVSSPFRSIIGLSDLLKVEANPADAAELIALMEKSAKNGISITQELLQHYKQFQEEDATEWLKLMPQLQEVISLYQNAASLKGINLALQSEADHQLKTKPRKLRRVIDNLLSNAVKFCKSGDNILIQSLVKGQNLCIIIKDSGPGFSENDQKKAFKPFQRLSAVPTQNENSTGLGLFIVRKLVHELGGTLELESTKGQGSTFTICLPKKLHAS